jgi:N-acetylglucosamine-6-sulfatase
VDMDYRAVRTERYKYIHWLKHPDEDELYDLKSDSLETRNIARDPSRATLRESLRRELGRLVAESVGLSK